MGKGNKRNSLCWCDSGLKFKNCHANRESEEKVKIYDVEKDFKTSHTKRMCMAPEKLHSECNKRIINAHTISKSSNLKQISKDGHVLGFKKNIQELHKNNGIFPIGKIGINNASILNNFCSTHDKELFSVIEDQEFIFSNEQIFMLAYRIICRELYLKYCSQTSSMNMKKYDKGFSLKEQIYIQSTVDFMLNGAELAIRDLENLKNKFDDLLLKKDFSKIKYYCLILDSVPQIMSSCGWIPTDDFDGNKLANLNNTLELFNNLSVSTIALGQKGAVIFAWLDVFEKDYCLPFIESLNKIPNDNKGSAILNWLLQCNENIFFSEDWWNGLDKNKQNLMINLVMEIMTNCVNFTNYVNYKDFLSWNITEIKKNY
ncbi:SEC-C metal-binding domain-containing protein [Aliarcobacter butzleri]|uniref:SEC-C metal-binding domain-containing protein n=1 Tax=Aliarcobacter butzleri TaxID=28197 RepID=UPI003AF5C425